MTATIVFRDDLVEVEVEYEYVPRDEDVGIMLEGGNIQKVLLGDEDITDQLTIDQLAYLTQEVDKHVQESGRHDD